MNTRNAYFICFLINSLSRSMLHFANAGLYFLKNNIKDMINATPKPAIQVRVKVVRLRLPNRKSQKANPSVM